MGKDYFRALGAERWLPFRHLWSGRWTGQVKGNPLNWTASFWALVPDPSARHPRAEFSVPLCFLVEKEMATHSSVLAWKIPRTEEPGRLQSMGLQRQTRLSDWAWACFLNIFFMFSLNNLPHSHWDHDFLICVLSSPCRTPTPNIGLTIKPWSIQSEETMQYYIWHYWRVFNYMEKGFSGITWKVSKMCI